LKLGVASSSSREWVVGHLGRLSITNMFDAIVTEDDVAHVKPDPELYLLTLARLGLDASEALVFEDAPNGVLAAKRAGLFAVAVPNALICGLPLDVRSPGLMTGVAGIGYQLLRLAAAERVPSVLTFGVAGAAQ
jgi:beta-phosphoglucomutase-like phosphatase (HAD superfamily)